MKLLSELKHNRNIVKIWLKILKVHLCIFSLVILTAWQKTEITHDIETQRKPWTHLDFDDNPDNFQFVIVADRTGATREGVFRKAVEKINLLRPEFVICVGDLIQGLTEDRKELVAQWNEFKSIAEKFKAPFFYLPGNHDISYSNASKKMHEQSKELWEELFGRTYYYFVYKNVLFICLNTTEKRPQNLNLGDEQISWAKKVLKDHPDVRWTCILMHHPGIWNGKEMRLLENALKDRKYTVFAGDLHEYTAHVRNGRKYFVLATTGGVSKLRGISFGEFDHCMWVTMTDDGPVIANLLIDGIMPEDIVTEKKRKEIKSTDSKK